VFLNNGDDVLVGNTCGPWMRESAASTTACVEMGPSSMRQECKYGIEDSEGGCGLQVNKKNDSILG